MEASSNISVSSDGSKQSKAKKPAPNRSTRDTFLKPTSVALRQAMQHIKDFMTDSQKSHIFLREGKLLNESGDFHGAIECFSEGISLNPTLVSLYLSRATAHKSLNMWNEAYFDYSFAIRLEPEVGSHYCSRGITLSKLKRISLALEDLDHACQLDPSPQNFYARASIFLEFNKLELAIKDFTHALDMESTRELLELRLKCLYKRASANYELGNYRESFGDLTAILQDDPNSVQARALLGKTFKMTDDLKKAEDQLSNAILLDADQPLWYLERGDIRFRTGRENKIIDAIYDFDKAIKLLLEKIQKLITDAQSQQNPSKLVAKLRNRTFSSTSPDFASDSSFSSNRSLYSAVFGLQELEETIADAFCKRAQAKLMLTSADPSVVNQAFNDITKALNVHSEDEGYLLVASTCYIRLGEYENAVKFLTKILDMNPDNDKALYQMSFCEKFKGRPKDAIEGLTKILSLTESESEPDSERMGLTIPIHCVYESRGTIFHEIQAHKLALVDLGRAVALNPERAENFMLLGNCHSKLGNYEQAIASYNYAESKGYQDAFNLLVSRGSVHRIMKNLTAAANDFEKAALTLPADRKVSLVRIKSMQSMCYIDQKLYTRAYILLLESQGLLKELIKTKEKRLQPLAIDSDSDLDPVTPEDTVGDELSSSTLSYLKSMLWVMLYHSALTCFLQDMLDAAGKDLETCVKADFRSFAPDNFTVGIAYFYLGQVHIKMGNLTKAQENFKNCLETDWANIEWNKFLTSFALAKGYQIAGKHSDAIEYFNKALSIEHNNPHALFRRAWSYKALGDYKAAGNDFELSKTLKIDDPNFSIDYKTISNVEFMELQSDPDLLENFPSLLQLPQS